MRSRSRLPLAYLQARQDQMVPARCLELVRALRPDVRARTLDGPHLLVMRCPEESAPPPCGRDALAGRKRGCWAASGFLGSRE